MIIFFYTFFFLTSYLMLISEADAHARNSNGLCREFMLSSSALPQKS